MNGDDFISTLLRISNEHTNNKTTEKLRIVAGTLIFQNGTFGSSVFVIILTDFFFMCAKRAKYWGRGCSS